MSNKYKAAYRATDEGARGTWGLVEKEVGIAYENMYGIQKSDGNGWLGWLKSGNGFTSEEEFRVKEEYTLRYYDYSEMGTLRTEQGSGVFLFDAQEKAGAFIVEVVEQMFMDANSLKVEQIETSPTLFMKRLFDDYHDILSQAHDKFLAEAIRYENNQPTSLEALCVKKRYIKILPKFRFILCNLLVTCFILGGIFAKTQIIFVSIMIPISIILLVLQVLEDREGIADGYSRFLKHTTKNYRDFLSIFEKYPNLSVKGLEYFGYQDPVTYKLFNAVMTFAFNSFTLADTQGDKKALERILRPIVADLFRQVQLNYREHLEIEQAAANAQKRQLQQQIDSDLHAYEHRIFKEL
ncbi:hypothetical protein [Lactococcus allomyrinae]|uniref:Uncharacterized protein n=1 Tax=Lactococcus allomyrinae TaxID=2419773 RepID=A0A387BDP1_9LACT|nr:hypothetical protein [Lactococcus allomyrinae]AYF99778.1 hypothetical protein D7I46_00955 [Lactococcus allomyrinae]